MPRLLLLLRLLAVLLWLPLAALAQTAAQAVDYEAWERVATRAEEAVSNARASTDAFEVLRAQVAEYRTEFLNAQNTNAARIETVGQQIAALGPPPEDGTEEAPELAQRRANLLAQLAELRAPRIRAEEAFSRANGLVTEIDRIIRTRQAENFFQLGPSPLNPVHWPEALGYVTSWVQATALEFRLAVESPARRDIALQRLPAIAALLLVGVVALLRARRWARRMSGFLIRRAPDRLDWVIGTVVSALGTVIAIAGISAIASALLAVGLVAQRIDALATLLMWVAGWIWGAVWLGQTLFPATPLDRPFLAVPPQDARPARRALFGLGLAAALYEVEMVIVAQAPRITEEGQAVIGAVPVLIGAIFAARFGQVLSRVGREHADETSPDADAPAYRERVVVNLGRFLIAVAVIGAAAKLAGYSVAAETLVEPLILTVALLGLVLVVQRVLVDLFLTVTGRVTGAAQAQSAQDGGTEGLTPVLIGIVVFVAALPLLALAWGARAADLTEIWTVFLAGFTLGETRVSPSNLFLLIVVFGLGYSATRVVQGTLRNTVLPKTRLDAGGRTALVSGVGYVGIFLAALIAITSAGIDLSSLAIVAGALSVGIGFGLQNVVQNFISGIILLIERPVGEGDWIEVGGNMGIVKKISVRSTTIETFTKQQVIVPNGDFITGTVTNWTRGNSLGRADVTVGVAYGTDTRKVHDILLAIAKGQPEVIQYPEPGVDFLGFGADSLDFRIRAMLFDVNTLLKVKNEMHHRIAERFAEEGIEIPFAQRDIWIRNADALTGGPAAALGAGQPPHARPEAGQEAAPGPETGDPDDAPDGSVAEGRA